MKASTVIKTILKVFLILLLIIVLIVGGYIGYVFLSYKRVEDNKQLTVEKRGEVSEAKLDTTYSIMTYNIGFGAYTSDFSFFMDGGESSWAKNEPELIDNIVSIGNDIYAVKVRKYS